VAASGTSEAVEEGSSLMNRKTLLQICQDALSSVKDISTPTTIINNSATEAVLLKQMATKVGRELERGYNWQCLVREHTFTTSGVAAYALPTDYRRMAPITGWDRTGDRPLVATNLIGYQALKSGIVVSGINYFLNVYGNQFQFQPIPPSGLSFALFYYSSQFIDTSAIDATGLDDWTADANVCRFDGDLMTLGVTFRYLNRQGAPCGEEKADYIQAIKDLQGDDQPMSVIDTGPSVTGLPYGNIPDSSWSISDE
jgi:hypothetical protein